MSKNNRFAAAIVTAAISCMASATASAFDPGNLTARLRAIYISTSQKSTGGALPVDDVHVESKWAPDIDFEYALADHWGLELLLTIPQRHEVRLESSNTKVGTVDELPPTLTAKYYFLTDMIRPYVGAGLNFTYFTGTDLLPGFDVKKTSVGPALQAGLDVGFNENWSLSVDVKKVWMSTDVKLNGARVTTLHIDPWIYGIGAGYRFGGRH